jgi:hypothetical protein
LLLLTLLRERCVYGAQQEPEVIGPEVHALEIGV